MTTKAVAMWAKMTAGALVLGGASMASAAVIEVRVLADGSKAAMIDEGQSVTLGIYLANLETLTNGSNGLGSISVSLRSYDEKANGVAWSPVPTASDTVTNATAAAHNLPSYFDLLPTAGTVQDISGIGVPTTPAPSEVTDTDIDLRGMGGTQQADGGWTTGYGVGPTETLVGTVTFQALDLDDITRALNRTVLINTYFTTSTGGGGGLVIKPLGPGGTSVDGTNRASAGIIGAPVEITVTANVIPLPTALPMGLVGLGLVGMVVRRRIVRNRA